jgi:transcriptional regulator with XRE-family HTH domain
MAKLDMEIITQEEFQAAFARRLKKLRKEKTGLSAENFSIRVNIARPLYRSYEIGANITAKNLVKILNGLEVTVEEFFTDFTSKS